MYKSDGSEALGKSKAEAWSSFGQHSEYYTLVGGFEPANSQVNRRVRKCLRLDSFR